MAQASCAASTCLPRAPAVAADRGNGHHRALWRECRQAGPRCQQKCGMSCSPSDQGPLLFREGKASFPFVSMNAAAFSTRDTIPAWA
jgi:hypothetical protein